jgi:hypothetical protein
VSKSDRELVFHGGGVLSRYLCSDRCTPNAVAHECVWYACEHVIYSMWLDDSLEFLIKAFKLIVQTMF